MKCYLTGVKKLIVLFYLVTVTYSQALNIPKTVHRVADIDKARQEAADAKKPVCFIKSMAKLKPT